MPYAEAKKPYYQEPEPSYSRQRSFSSRCAPRRKGFLKWWISLFVLMAINLIVQSLVIKLDYDSGRWQEQIRIQEREVLKTRLEIATLGSLDRIRDVAENRLGMRLAGPNDYQCIALAPPPKPYQPIAKVPAETGDLWVQVKSWLGGLGTVAAQPSSTP
jgi:cell division protein FtsL